MGAELTMVAGVPTGRSRDYVTVLRCDAGDSWLPEARSQIEGWLRGKNFDVSLAESGDYVNGSRTLTVRTDLRNGVGDLKIVMTEPSDRGTWTSELISHDEPGNDDWISIRVTNDRGNNVAVPNVARHLMEALPLRDGLLELEASSRRIHGDQVDGLVEAVKDSERHGLVFVAGSENDSEISFEAWADKVEYWSRQVHGLAKVFVLDPATTRAFAAAVGSPLAAPPWAIRTYQPGVDLEDPHDARRHRILGTSRLGHEPDAAIRGLLGDIARQHALTRAPDAAVQRVQRRFERLENRRLVDSLETANMPPVQEPAAEVAEPRQPEAAAAAQQLGLVKRVLGLVEITEQSLTSFLSRLTGRDTERRQALKARVDSLQAQVEELEDENALLTEVLADAQLETEIAHIDIDDRDGKIRWLNARLKEKGDYTAEFEEVPDEFLETRPSSFDELLDWLERIEGVSFTGDPKDVARLDQVDTNGAALRVAWDAVLVMADYVRCRREGSWEHGLNHFIEHTPEGCHEISARKFAETETAATMKQFGDERWFAVPPEVDPSERALMKAHFKLARIGHVDPRMHIYDAHPDVPMVCIGYIGTHLTNTHT